MGRWFNKIKNDSLNELTKPTESTPVSSVGMYYSDIAKKNIENDSSSIIIHFVQASCEGMRIDPQLIIEDLLSIEDEQDIVDGYVTVEQLNYLIELWVSSGMKRVSGKAFG